MQYKTSSARQTQKLAAKLAQNFKNGAVLALQGPLGAGKTTFIQGFAQGLGIKDRLISPTFVLMRQYTLPKSTYGKLFHLDLYRLDSLQQIKNLGIEEVLSNPQNIVLIEWAEKIAKVLPKKTVWIKLKPLSYEEREIDVGWYLPSLTQS